MSESLPVFTLSDVLHRLGVTPEPHGAADILAEVEGMRLKEMRLRAWIPAKLLRRFDRGFARSYTIQPSTARALYAIAVARRSEVIVETGTYWGYSTALLAAACRDSGHGIVQSFDLYKHAGRHIPAALMPWVRLHRGRPAADVIPSVLAGSHAGLFFQDSVHDYDGVLAELQTAAPYLTASTIVLFHDFVVDAVRTAARDGLPGYLIGRLDVDDPQQLGIAFGSAFVSS